MTAHNFSTITGYCYGCALHLDAVTSETCEPIDWQSCVYAEPDAVGDLMREEGLSFVEAVERLARQRGIIP